MPPPKPKKRKGESQRAYNARLNAWNKSQKKRTPTTKTSGRRGRVGGEPPSAGGGGGNKGKLTESGKKRAEGVQLEGYTRMFGRPEKGGKTSATVENFFSRFARTAKEDPSRYNNIQHALYNAGYYGEDEPVYGSFRAEDQTAIGSALADAAAQSDPKKPLDFEQYLQEESGRVSAAGGPGALGGGGKEPKMGEFVDRPQLFQGGGTFEFTAHQDVSANMRQAFSDALGRNPSTEEELRFIESYKNQELMAQQLAQNQKDYTERVQNMAENQVINQKLAGQGAVEAGANVEVGGQTHTLQNAQITQPADPRAMAEWIARTQHPAEYQASQASRRLDELLGMMQGRAPGGTALGGGG